MKPYFFLLFSSFLWSNLHAQFQDNFSDGNFSSNPTWSGNTNRFLVNAAGELQLNDSMPVATNATYLVTNAPTSLDDSTTWEFYVRLEFATSTTNFARVYLAANQADINGNVIGYFLKIGGATGSTDAIELYRQDGVNTTLLLSGTAGAVGGDPVTARVRVTRSTAGEWTLFADYQGGTNFKREGSVLDATYYSSNYFGFYARYSSTRNKAFFFDDVFINPLFTDTTPPKLLEAKALSATQVEVTFDEPLAANVTNIANFSIDKNIGNPVSVVLSEPTKVVLTLNTPLASGVNYALSANNITDLNDNRSGAQSANFIFYDIQPIAPGDLILNEILFNPATGGSDFIELYNASNKTLNINGLQISNTTKTGSTASETVTTSFLLLPNTYVAISENPADLRTRYQPPTTAVLLENDLPSFDDDAGNVTIRANGVTIDSFDYLDDYHFALLSDKEGVSLERISFSSATQGSNNWQSAAASVLFATPGYQNSQFNPSNTTTDQLISIANKRFSPDGDGYEDVLLIDYNADQSGLTANIHIFDANGRLVTKLVQNEGLAARGNFKWDGTTDEGSKARIGIYVIWIELLSPMGRVERRKETCVLAGKLD